MKFGISHAHVHLPYRFNGSNSEFIKELPGQSLNPVQSVRCTEWVLKAPSNGYARKRALATGFSWHPWHASPAGFILFIDVFALADTVPDISDNLFYLSIGKSILPIRHCFGETHRNTAEFDNLEKKLVRPG